MLSRPIITLQITLPKPLPQSRQFLPEQSSDRFILTTDAGTGRNDTICSLNDCQQHLERPVQSVQRGLPYVRILIFTIQSSCKEINKVKNKEVGANVEMLFNLCSIFVVSRAKNVRSYLTLTRVKYLTLHFYWTSVFGCTLYSHTTDTCQPWLRYEEQIADNIMQCTWRKH